MMLRILIFSLFFLSGFFAHSSNSCGQILKQQSTTVGPYEFILERFKEAQVDYHDTQNTLIDTVNAKLEARSLKSSETGDQAVPMIEVGTLNLMARWGALDGRVKSMLLRHTILLDPYMLWLTLNWKDLRPPQFKELGYIDLSHLTRLSGGQGPSDFPMPERIDKYFHVHLMYSDEQISLKPELFVLRLMRDHDGMLPVDLRQDISEVLEIEKKKFLLKSYIQMLSFGLGADIEYWQRFTGMSDVFTQLRSIDKWFRNAAGESSERDFLNAQLPNLSLEEGDIKIIEHTRNPESSFVGFLVRKLTDSENEEVKIKANSHLELQRMILFYGMAKSHGEMDAQLS